MGLRVSTNIASLSAQRSIRQNNEELTRSLRALSSGKRVNRAGDDAAGFSIGESLRGQIRSSRQARFNADSAISLVQTAEGGLNEQNNILIRLRELATQAASDTVSDTEREFLDDEFQVLIEEFDRISKTTLYGSKSLLSGSDEQLEFHVGINDDDSSRIAVTLDSNTSADNVGIAGNDVLDKGDARDSLESIDEALVDLTRARAKFGALQSRLQFTSDHLGAQIENITAARSQIVDADIAEEVTNLVSAQIQEEAGISVLAQATQSPKSALQLLHSINR